MPCGNRLQSSFLLSNLAGTDLSENQTFIESLKQALGSKNLLTDPRRIRYYSTGFRVGSGDCCAVALPDTLRQIWDVLKLCVEHDKAIILQAANTGLNGGSTPFGDGYDREIVIISTLKISQINLIRDGEQVIALAGSTLYQLEDILRPINRGPHSVIGSSCIGASVVGGVCNNSGGNLVNRGPAYTQMSVYAQLTHEGELKLVNHLGIDLGDTPEEILDNLQTGNFDKNPQVPAGQMASDSEYQQRVRDVDADSPARFNADSRRHHEASGCAGKLAVFAVRLDTFPMPEREQVFFVSTNRPQQLTELRRRILSEFETLPEMGEYMHNSFFDASDKYCKDTFLAIKYMGTAFLPRLFKIKAAVDSYLSKLSFLPNKLPDRILQLIANIWPDHLPKRVRGHRAKYEHHLIIKANNEVIETTQNLLEGFYSQENEGEFFAADKKEGEAILLHRFVAGGAPMRYAIINGIDLKNIVPFDIALRRNDDGWHDLYPPEILNKIAAPNRLAHFFCMVFHHDFVLKPGIDPAEFKKEILALLDSRGAKYPAEHNVGHLYHAEDCLQQFYKECDPSNSFNPGVGKMSKLKNYA